MAANIIQIGVIVFSNGVDHEFWISDFKKRGFEIRIMEDHVELWGDPKALQKGES